MGWRAEGGAGRRRLRGSRRRRRRRGGRRRIRRSAAWADGESGGVMVTHRAVPHRTYPRRPPRRNVAPVDPVNTRRRLPRPPPHLLRSRRRGERARRQRRLRGSSWTSATRFRRQVGRSARLGPSPARWRCPSGSTGAASPRDGSKGGGRRRDETRRAAPRRRGRASVAMNVVTYLRAY